jgi:hypothetical protein
LIPATLVLRELRALGYEGGISILKQRLATLRPAGKPEPFPHPARYGVPAHALPLVLRDDVWSNPRRERNDVRRIIVAAGICVREVRPLRYAEFARFGIPVMIVQLIVNAIYLKLRFLR